MKLTNVLFRIGKRLPKGHLYRGKYRLVKKVTPLLSSNKKAEYALEEKNMFYIRHPYLTLEQEKGHAKSFNHHEKFLEKQIDKKLKNWGEHKLLGDRFGFLKISDAWE